MPFDDTSFTEHEEVSFVTDIETGLRAIIAVHSTVLGPAAGGCRMLHYVSPMAGLADVLRASEAMTYKNALAGLPLGGGTSVILAGLDKEKSPALLHAFGERVNRLAGRYYAAEDMGIGVDDIETMGAVTPYVFGRSSGATASGDPSAFIALGVLMGIRAALWHRLGRSTLEGARIAVQGVGSTGRALCRLLSAEGALLWASDIDRSMIERTADEMGVTIVDPESIYDQVVDVFAPCAIGGTVNESTIERLRAPIIAGTANNQLAFSAIGEDLYHRNILFAPDYVINAGGMLNASCDIFGSYDRDAVIARIDAIYERCIHIFERAKAEQRPTNLVADNLARSLINRARAQARGRRQLL